MTKKKEKERKGKEEKDFYNFRMETLFSLNMGHGLSDMNLKSVYALDSPYWGRV